MVLELILSVTGVKYSNGDGYYFRLSQKLHNKIYLNCQVKSCQVRGNIPMNYDKDVIIKCKGTHNHPPDFYEAEFCELERRILERSATEVIPLRRIFLEETTGASPRAVTRLNYPSFLRRMQRRRQFTKRSVPSSFADFSALMLAKDCSEFSHINGQQFFISEIGNHSILFMSPVMRDLMKTDDQVFSVYQFKKFICQSLKQILIIAKIFNNVAFPVAYVGMQTRTKNGYKEVLQRIQEEEPLWNPVILYAGTEIALCSAISDVFENCQIVNSWFHYAQELRREIRNLDLITLLHSELPFYKCLQLLELIPLLPADRFEEGIEVIQEKLKKYLSIPGINHLLGYIKSTWLQGARAEELSLVSDPTKSNVELKLLNRQLMHSIRGNTRQDAIWSFTRSLVVVEKKYSDAYLELTNRGSPPKWTANCSFKSQEKKIRNSILRFYSVRMTAEKYLDDISRTTITNTLDLHDDGDIEFADGTTDEENAEEYNEDYCDPSESGEMFIQSTIEAPSDYNEKVKKESDVRDDADFDEYIVEEVEEQEYSDNESVESSFDEFYVTQPVTSPAADGGIKHEKPEERNRKRKAERISGESSVTGKRPNVKSKGSKLLVFNSNASNATSQELEESSSEIVHVCVTCKNNIYSYACFPCGHLCLCDTCSGEFVNKKCPICSKKVMWVQRIFLPHPLT